MFPRQQAKRKAVRLCVGFENPKTEYAAGRFRFNSLLGMIEIWTYW